MSIDKTYNELNEKTNKCIDNLKNKAYKNRKVRDLLINWLNHKNNDDLIKAIQLTKPCRDTKKEIINFLMEVNG